MKNIIYFILILSSSFTFGGCNSSGNYGKEVLYGNTQIFYKSEVTESEANALGDFLVKSDFNKDGEKKSVQLVKSGSTYQFRMIIKKGIEQDPEYIELFKQFAGEVSANVFHGANVEIHACDDQFNTLRVFLMRG